MLTLVDDEDEMDELEEDMDDFDEGEGSFGDMEGKLILGYYLQGTADIS